MGKRILVVLTNTAKYPDMPRATGLWFSEAVHFIHALQGVGHSIEMASPMGLHVPIDPASLGEMAEPIDWTYYQDHVFMSWFDRSLRLETIDPTRYQAIYFAGGHGTMWDFPSDPSIRRITSEIYENGGVVAAVCHGVSALLDVTLFNRNLLIRDKEITGFSDEEEQLEGLATHVPFSLETAINVRGGLYRKATVPFAPFMVSCQRVVTGQNPASTRAVAQELILLL